MKRWEISSVVQRRTGGHEEFQANVDERLYAGWEPFAAVGFVDGTTTLWFRRATE